MELALSGSVCSKGEKKLSTEKDRRTKKEKRDLVLSSLCLPFRTSPKKALKLKPQRENEGLREAGLPRPLSPDTLWSLKL